jgi:acetolactate decarboxylase
MKPANILVVPALLLAIIGLSSCSPAPKSDALTQISTIDALLNGVYDGVMSLGELKEYGDFGIGTFEGLDGEMVFYDGVFYQVKADGVAYVPADSVTAPFAAVTFFDTDKEVPLAAGTSYVTLQTFLDGILPTNNIFYAVEITGTFSYVQTRSVPAQQKPYPPLAAVTADQSVFEFTNVAGTIVGFISPPYVDGISVPGFHLHFLTADKQAGGHVLDLQISEATAAIDYISEFNLTLPGSDSDFYDLDLTPDLSDDLEQVEK